MEIDALFDQAILGEQLDNFWRSDVGNFVLAKAEREYIMALGSLVEVDPSDTKAILKHQSDAKRASSIKQWLSEGITQGLKAKEILEDRES